MPGMGSMQAGSLSSDTADDQMGRPPPSQALSATAWRSSMLDPAWQGMNLQPSGPSTSGSVDARHSASSALDPLSPAQLGTTSLTAESSQSEWPSSMLDPFPPKSLGAAAASTALEQTSPSSVAGQTAAETAQLSWRSSMMDPSHPSSMAAADSASSPKHASPSSIAGQSTAEAAQLSWRSSMLDPSHPTFLEAAVPAPASQHALHNVQADPNLLWRSSMMDPSQPEYLQSRSSVPEAEGGGAAFAAHIDSSWRSRMLEPAPPSLRIQPSELSSPGSLDGVPQAAARRAVHTKTRDATSIVNEQLAAGGATGRDLASRLEMQYDACASWWTQARTLSILTSHCGSPVS